MDSTSDIGAGMLLATLTGRVDAMSEEPVTPAELQRAVDADTLLPGEDPASPYIDDAAHWMRVYGELIAFKDSMLDRAEEALEELSTDALHDINVDRRLLRIQAARYRARYEYWMRRAAEIGQVQGAAPWPVSPPHLRIQGPTPDSECRAAPAGT